jgi:hypothetical protein
MESCAVKQRATRLKSGDRLLGGSFLWDIAYNVHDFLSRGYARSVC